MKKKNVLIIGSVVTIVLGILWIAKIVEEPIAALGTMILTFLGYLYSDNEENSPPRNNTKGRSQKIKQIHSGKGDNVLGDKNTNHP